jgi:hypothetical protein
MSVGLRRNPTAHEVDQFVNNFAYNNHNTLGQTIRKFNPLVRFGNDYVADLLDLTCCSVRWSRSAKFNPNNPNKHNAYGYFNLLCTAYLVVKDVQVYTNHDKHASLLTIQQILNVLASNIFADNPDRWTFDGLADAKQCVVAGPDQFDRLWLSQMNMYVV